MVLPIYIRCYFCQAHGEHRASRQFVRCSRGPLQLAESSSAAPPRTSRNDVSSKAAPRHATPLYLTTGAQHARPTAASILLMARARARASPWPWRADGPSRDPTAVPIPRDDRGGPGTRHRAHTARVARGRACDRVAWCGPCTLPRDVDGNHGMARDRKAPSRFRF